ncbi:MAG TPA: hypothetical protein VNZ52_00165 [Candidatus Thermoplasmatota archaeon]|nr:hypothetical protein [Candidatus Thermoplasmatota archaeon]
MSEESWTMNRILQFVSNTLPLGSTFDPRVLARRVGKQLIYPRGIGSALNKAVREGYLTVVSEGTSRRASKYRLTEEGRRFTGPV